MRSGYGGSSRSRPHPETFLSSPRKRGPSSWPLDARFRGHERSTLPSCLFPFLRLIPQGVHFGERRVLRPLADGGEAILDRREAPLDLEITHSQRGLGIDIEMTREVDHHEQEIADLPRNLVPLPGVKLGFDLVGFFANFSDHRLRIVPVEADLARFLLQLE